LQGNYIGTLNEDDLAGAEEGEGEEEDFW
jgi:hypothetical protein